MARTARTNRDQSSSLRVFTKDWAGDKWAGDKRVVNFACRSQRLKTSPMDKDSVNINSTIDIADEESRNNKTVESGANDQENIRFTSAFIGSSSGNINSTMHIADEESRNNKTVESEANDQGNPP
ncbi:hypothetical protein L1887_14584 [Cichorium endivia]|nr:hypothetical protein L1887_14584 [Cichorium endivia]